MPHLYGQLQLLLIQVQGVKADQLTAHPEVGQDDWHHLVHCTWAPDLQTRRLPQSEILTAASTCDQQLQRGAVLAASLVSA